MHISLATDTSAEGDPGTSSSFLALLVLLFVGGLVSRVQVWGLGFRVLTSAGFAGGPRPLRSTLVVSHTLAAS